MVIVLFLSLFTTISVIISTLIRPVLPTGVSCYSCQIFKDFELVACRTTDPMRKYLQGHLKNEEGHCP